MPYALLTLAAAGSILFLIGALRQSRVADDASDETSRRLAYTEWPHIPRDGSRGVLK